MSCCSGSSFTPAPDASLDPEQRVNFTFGMVLGVDDFRQEHAYLAARDERALREIIGYGVLSGLDVKTEPALEGDLSKYTVRVAPGLALLPNGKLVGVPADQCASITEWLSGANKKPASATGAFSVYIVLRYAESTGTPVPIPGEPCRDESALQADSRITNSFSLDFSWEAPVSTEDNALRTFAAWLRTLPVLSAPSPEPNVADFQSALETAVVTAIANGWPASVKPPLAETPAPSSSALVIPYTHYAEFISAAFDVWIRRLRGLYIAKHGPLPPAEEEAETGLLLAAVDITLKDGLFDKFSRTRMLGRPQLAHLRLLQEWLFTQADEAPRDAHYVLGKADPRLTNAQDLHEAFTGATRNMARVELSAGDGLIKPALIWPGTGADYYGPVMDAPIPVGDGGTGQSGEPGQGQLLVGAPSATTPRAFVLGVLKGVTHSDGGDAKLVNIIVDKDAEAPNILLDTVQDIDPQASPTFAGLTVTAALIAGSLSVEGIATITGALTASGGISTTALTLTGFGASVVGTDASGALIQATRWDGLEAKINTTPTYYYAPGQDHAVRIEDGGTGLTARPAAMQMLVGRNDGVKPLPYVLATLTAGENVALTLAKTTPTLGPGPSRREEEWTLTIDARGGTGIALPLVPTQGGTGQIEVPALGQILLGDGSAKFGLGNVGAGDRGKGPNLTVSASATALTIDTVQDLHTKAAPIFEGLFLTEPSKIKATHGLGWNSEKRDVVVTALPQGRDVIVIDKIEKFPTKPAEWSAALGAGDHVLVYTDNKPLTLNTFPPPTIDGQMVILKVYGKGEQIVLEDNGTIDLGTIRLETGSSLTLVGSTQIKQWLVVGRS